MRKIQKVLIGIFLAGVLLGGAGTGIALTEYASFSYGGEKVIGSDSIVTSELDYVFDPKQGPILVLGGWYLDNPHGSLIETDETVPEGTIRYVVTYNEAAVTPYLFYEERDEELTGQESWTIRKEPGDPQRPAQGCLRMSIRHEDNDLTAWMLLKDDFLTELKQRKISAYRSVSVESVQVKVHPKTRPYLIDQTCS